MNGGRIGMSEHNMPSWKEDEVVSKLYNSVLHVSEAVGQAYSNPSNELINEAREKVVRADKTLANAIEARGETEPIVRLSELLDAEKDQLNLLH